MLDAMVDFGYIRNGRFLLLNPIKLDLPPNLILKRNQEGE